MSVYADALNATMAIARHAAVFAPTCAIHCYTAYWTAIAIDGISMAEAIGRFVSSPRPSGMLWFDSCRGPNCNPTCPRVHGGGALDH